MARGGGLGLGGIAVVLGALYFTGAGAWMLQRMQGLERGCYGMISSIGVNAGGPVCAGVGKGVNAITQVSDTAGQHLKGIKDWVQGLTGMGSFSGSLQQSVAGLSSSSDRLNQMISQGPRQWVGGNTAQQFQQAVDSFTIGQNYLTSGASAAQALPWLRQGASQPQGFGVMSQLSLGDLYRNGGNGVAANPSQAEAYYAMASNSVAQLSGNSSPQAQQLLQTLPGSPEAIQQQIAKAIAQLKVSTH